nr:MOSC domain-containing protein [Paradevosia shaoguanensis]
MAVNLGKPERIPSKTGMTGIFKRPQVGPMRVGKLGLEGDAVLDRKHHGGVDQAIYVYFQSDYDFWDAQMGTRIQPGTFGENLTVDGVDGMAVCVGDRFAIGGAVLEVTSHRTPCSVFAARMGDPRWVKTFHRAGRPGAYCRVIAEGAVEAGMDVGYQKFSGEPLTISELMALDGVREIPRATLERALRAPVHYKMRDDYEERLASLF